MHRWPSVGPSLFAAAAAALGAEHLLIGNFVPGLEQVPGSGAVRTMLAVLYGLALGIGGVAYVVGVQRRWSATLLAAAFSLFWFLVQVQPFAYYISNGSVWTRMFESLAMAGAGVALAGAQWGGMAGRRARLIGRVLFGLSLLVFGGLHFTYLEFTATLVPAWIPARVFWAGFVGAAFVAAGIALVTGIQGRFAAFWTGVMFAGFIFLLHLPLVVGSIRSPGQWSSALVALLMWGGAWIVGASVPPRDTV